jgi:anti-sigma regulatory factor (Ser/Thr protein kinase)
LQTSILREADLGSPESGGANLQLIIRNAIEALGPSQQELRRFCEHIGLSGDVTNRVEVIFEELTSNAIRHGFTPGSPQSVHVRATATPHAVELTFEDDGRQFNPVAHVRPKRFTNLENAKLGGLGVALALRLTSSIRYEAPGGRSAQGGFRPSNRTIVTVSRAP